MRRIEQRQVPYGLFFSILQGAKRHLREKPVCFQATSASAAAAAVEAPRMLLLRASSPALILQHKLLALSYPRGRALGIALPNLSRISCPVLSSFTLPAVSPDKEPVRFLQKRQPHHSQQSLFPMHIQRPSSCAASQSALSRVPRLAWASQLLKSWLTQVAIVAAGRFVL